ncbi:MAG: hypothetical protein A2169_06570 [Deltaproteobacteria bacterium RBG_13_47_9]|nr:MAG: hypothetical protein A2169_06570 [Deltaproteobacteria bacterium RBG_13_47_9]
MEIYILSGTVLFAAGFLSGLAGFGNALLSIPMLGLFLDIKTVIPVACLSALAVQSFILYQLWDYLDFNKIRPLLLSAIPGVFIGIVILKYSRKEIIQVIFGATLVFYSLYKLIVKQTCGNRNRQQPYLFGLLSGFMGGAVGASGPPIIIYTHMQQWPKDIIKVTMQGYFILSDLLILIGQMVTGLITPTVIRIFFISLPASVLGAYLGSTLYTRSREEDYRNIVLIILTFLGLLMLCRSFM